VAGLAQFAPTTVRLRLDFGYDGSAFLGWARQPGLRTVQGVFEPALATVLRLATPPSVIIAGRTDAGVHARGQVAHVDVPSSVIMHESSIAGASDTPFVHDHGQFGDVLARRLNGVLGLDVRVRSVSMAPEGFHARFAALSRRYSYRVADHWFFPPRRYDTLTHPRPLDLEAMNAAGAKLLGLHDFAAFCRRREGATTMRTLLAIEWTRDDAGVAIARVEADAFCHSMVRSLVGALLEVGDGRRDIGWPAKVLAGRDRAAAARVAAAHGLTLEEVRYPPDAELSARAQQTRRRRDPPDVY
jgi:tRNA pseudouridine38-40 synthase